MIVSSSSETNRGGFGLAANVASERRGWERIATPIMAYGIILCGAVTAIWLVVRNEPFREPMFAYSLRVFVALAAGMAVQVMPGAFRLGISERGVSRAIWTRRSRRD